MHWSPAVLHSCCYAAECFLWLSSEWATRSAHVRSKMVLITYYRRDAAPDGLNAAARHRCTRYTSYTLHSKTSSHRRHPGTCKL